MEQKQLKFPGFPEKPKENYWQYPEIMNGYWKSLTPVEQKILDYILRHTWGWHKTADYISYDQFKNGIKGLDEGTGIRNDKTLRKGLVGLENKGMIKIDSGKLKGRVNLYSLILLKGVGQEIQTPPVRSVEGGRVRSVDTINSYTINTNNNMSDKPTFPLKEEIEKLLTDKRRHIQIIGLWIQEMNLKPENQDQVQSIIHRNSRPAVLLKGYRNEDIQETIKILKRTEYLQGHFGIETITKFIDEVVANKKKKGPKILRWEEVKYPNGEIKMKPIYK